MATGIIVATFPTLVVKVGRTTLKFRPKEGFGIGEEVRLERDLTGKIVGIASLQDIVQGPVTEAE